jgi:putative hemolysin
MLALARGNYLARVAEAGADVLRAQDLRWRAFRAARHLGRGGRDADDFDGLCRHLLVEERQTGRLVAAARLLPLADGREIGRSYSARHYDLSGLASWPGRMMELGRFCLDPGCHDPDVIRIAWGAVTRLVDAEGAGMLFGCSSFPGTDAAPYRDVFAMLGARHRAPERWLPKVKAPWVVRFGGEAGPGLGRDRGREFDRGRGPSAGDAGRAPVRALPPLLKSYLAMGGWVGDHAVVDDDLGTLHVFTAVEVARIPPARARALRALAG